MLLSRSTAKCSCCATPPIEGTAASSSSRSPREGSMTGATCVTGATFWLVELQGAYKFSNLENRTRTAGVAKKLYRLHRLHRRLRAGGRGHEARWAGLGCCTSSTSGLCCTDRLAHV